MTLVLSLTVIAPVDQLAAVGETYATLRRSVELPYPPFIGLQLGLSTDLTNEDPRFEHCKELHGSVTNPTAIFEIQNVCYFMKNAWSEDQTVLTAKEAFEPDIKRWQSYIVLLCEFYGFERL